MRVIKAVFLPALLCIMALPTRVHADDHKSAKACNDELRTRRAELTKAGESVHDFIEDCWWHSKPGTLTPIVERHSKENDNGIKRQADDAVSKSTAEVTARPPSVEARRSRSRVKGAAYVTPSVRNRDVKIFHRVTAHQTRVRERLNVRMGKATAYVSGFVIRKAGFRVTQREREFNALAIMSQPNEEQDFFRSLVMPLISAVLQDQAWVSAPNAAIIPGCLNVKLSGFRKKRVHMRRLPPRAASS